MGTYLRHLIGIVVTAVVGAALALFGLTPELLTAEQADLVNKGSAFLETALWVGLTLIGYPLTEKFLKRFPSIDLRGFIDKKWLDAEKEAAERGTVVTPPVIPKK
jgi:hypothetical protein